MGVLWFFFSIFSQCLIVPVGCVSHRVFVVILSFVHLDIRHLFPYMKIFLCGLAFSNLIWYVTVCRSFVYTAECFKSWSTDLVLSDLKISWSYYFLNFFSAPAFWPNMTYITLLMLSHGLLSLLDLRKNFFLSLSFASIRLFLFLDYFYAFQVYEFFIWSHVIYCFYPIQLNCRFSCCFFLSALDVPFGSIYIFTSLDTVF